MVLEDIKATLPSHEDIWERPEIARNGKRSCTNSTLLNVMETIYLKRRLPLDLGDFSISILINAIYRNTENIVARDQIRLNSWVPTAFIQQPSEDTLTEVEGLPSTATASKWRNSACDCLDVLHWPANSKIARNMGFEHHTILHLHLARIIILIPTTQFQAFATGLIQSKQSTFSPNEARAFTRARYQVLQWAIKDFCKARLSVVHAGAVYWHVRRYSCDSVIEPYAIFMATLVLWSFCLCMQLPEVAANMAELPDEVPEPAFLHLDRPMDDELVQNFVRSGHKMSAYISHVGSLQERSAPAKILQEGICLLSKTPRTVSSDQSTPQSRSDGPSYTWGIEESYVATLRGLLTATEDTKEC